MKIVIDASQIIYETGVSVYTKNLIRSLLNIDKQNSYTIIGGSLRRLKELELKISRLCENKQNSDYKVFPFSPAMSDFIFNRLGFINIDLFIGKSDIFHSSDWVQPATNAYKITTIHDLAPVLYPKMTHPKIVEVHKRRLERVGRYADRIIVPSEATKEDLLKLGYSERKISVIPEAVDPDFKKSGLSESRRILKKYRINDKYLLMVGTSQRKNIERVISAFERIRTDTSLKLIVIGENKKHYSVRNVAFLGHIPSDDLVKIYCMAEALVYPSLYEGFGLPILEAFFLGVPVLTSNRGSMKEIAGKAAVLVDPYSVDEIADGIMKLLNKKAYYIKAGREEIVKYSWEKTALRTLDLYRESIK